MKFQGICQCNRDMFSFVFVEAVTTTQLKKNKKKVMSTVFTHFKRHLIHIISSFSPEYTRTTYDNGTWAIDFLSLVCLFVFMSLNYLHCGMCDNCVWDTQSTSTEIRTTGFWEPVVFGFFRTTGYFLSH